MQIIREGTKHPMISVIIPAYNAAAYIEETLESILNQTYQAFEIIVVDDGSTDDTVNIVKRYANQDRRIRLVQQSNQGSSQARNTGIALAQYEWIAPVDSDDVLLPQLFEKQLAAAAQYPQVIGWGTYATRITLEGRAYSVQETGPTTLEEFHRMRYETGEILVMPASSVLLRKDIVQKVGGYSSMTLEDLILLDDMAEYGPILVIPEHLILYRMHLSSKTGTLKRFRNQRAHFRYLEEKAKKRARKQTQLTLEEYLAAFRNPNQLIGAVRYIDDYSAYTCRVSAQRLGERKYAAFLKNTLVSFILNPYYVSVRVWSRIFKKKPLSKRL